MADDQHFYFCLTHSTVEEGQRCRAQDRMGPYPTAEAARSWKQTHGSRDDEWEAEDDRWEGTAD
jgi:hypothetical protein